MKEEGRGKLGAAKDTIIIHDTPCEFMVPPVISCCTSSTHGSFPCQGICMLTFGSQFSPNSHSRCTCFGLL